MLIFLHGFPESAYAWCLYLPYYAKLGFTVLAPDLRGYLLSTGFKSKKAWQIQIVAEDIKRLIEHVKHKKVVLIGHDLGGAVAWQVAEAYPQLCQSMILINSPHPGAHAKMFRASPWRTIRQTCRLWYVYAFQIPILPERLMLRGNGFWLDYIFKRWIRQDVPSLAQRIKFYKKSLSTLTAIKEAIATYRSNVFGAYGRRLLKPYLFGNDYQTIEANILMLWGEKDFLFENALYQYTQHYCHQKIQSKAWRNAGHWLHHEYQQEVMRQIDAFLNIKNTDTAYEIFYSSSLMRLFDECLKRKLSC